MSKIFSLACATFLLFAVGSFAQNKRDVLITLDGESVLKEDFVALYSKNLELIPEDEKSVDAYLERFIDFRIKVAEAQKQGLDTVSSYVKELKKYQDQLSENYLYEQEVTDAMVQEAYQRSIEQVNANHILMRFKPELSPRDTLDKYNKLVELRQRALDGEDFEALAREYSEEPRAATTSGSLGYFDAFKMVYAFEDAAYKTPVGSISEVVRTGFGWHIIKVNDRRPIPQEVTAAHIMVKKSGQSISMDNERKRIMQIYRRIEKGESFDNLIALSDDERTAQNGGVIGRFGSGRLNAPKFEEAAFALKEPGAISLPVETDFGWHIIKLVERHPRPTFEELETEIVRKVKQGKRGNVLKQSIDSRIKEDYNFQKDTAALTFFHTYVTDSILERKWIYDPTDARLHKTLFSLGDTRVTYADFAQYITERQLKGLPHNTVKGLVNKYYGEFEPQKLREIYLQLLAKSNREFRTLLAEYRDGLLVFSLMKKEIWGAVQKDSIGLENYFAKNQDNYVWKKRVDALIASTPNKALAEQVRQLLDKGETRQNIETALNTDSDTRVTFSEGLYEIDHHSLPENFEATPGLSKIYDQGQSPTVVLVREVLEEAPKSLEEARGFVLTGYQNEREEQWIQSLRQVYDIQVNKKAVRKLRKELE